LNLQDLIEKQPIQIGSIVLLLHPIHVKVDIRRDRD